MGGEDSRYAGKRVRAEEWHRGSCKKAEATQRLGLADQLTGLPTHSPAVVSSNAGFTGGMIGSSGNPMTAKTIR
jgi:hypothetical protein